jgi:quinol monooxygenase YgiN
MPVRLVVTFTAQPGRGSDFVRAWRERLPECNAEPGCEQYELFQSTTRPDTVVLLEEWSSPETLAAHAEVNKTRTPVGRDLLSGQPRVERFVT